MTAPPLGHIYDCLGITADLASATGTMPLGADAPARSTPAASFGLLLEQTCFLPLVASVSAVPIDIAVDVVDVGDGADAAVATARVLRRGRSLAVTEGRVVAASDPARLLALGSLTWSIVGPAEAAPAPAGRAVLRGDLLAALGVTVTGRGRCELDQIAPSLSGPGDVLHAGGHQLLAEVAASSATGGGAVRHLALRFLGAARHAPFVACATVEPAPGAHALCTIDVRDATRLVAHGVAHVERPR